MESSFPFGRTFQEITISLLFRAKPNYIIKQLIQPKHVEKKAHKIFISLFQQEQKQLSGEEEVSQLVIQDRIKKLSQFTKEERRFLLQEFSGITQRLISPGDEKYVVKELTSFVQYQNVVQVLKEESIYLLERKQLPLLQKKLNKAFCPVQEDTKALRYFLDIQTRFKQRFKKRRAKTIKTLIPEIDAVLKGNAVRCGSLNVVIGATGAGKSMLLSYLAKAAVIQRKKVLYITLQLTEDDIAERIDANFSGLTIFDAYEQVDKVIDVIEKQAVIYRDALKIKFFPAMTLTVAGLRDYLEQERQVHNFIPDLLVIDYGDLMVGEQTEDNGGRYYESGSVFDQLLGLAQEKNFVLWTASQSGRAGVSAKLLTLEHIAESFRKVMAAQLVLTLTRSVEEKKENKCRIYLAKNSFGRDDYLFTVNTAYDKGSFYSSKPLDS